MTMGLSSFWDDFTGKSAIKSAYADSNAFRNTSKPRGEPTSVLSGTYGTYWKSWQPVIVS
jgi:hypothetical protein